MIKRIWPEMSMFPGLLWEKYSKRFLEELQRLSQTRLSKFLSLSKSAKIFDSIRPVPKQVERKRDALFFLMNFLFYLSE